MISINPYEIILQMINFGILYYLLKRFLAKPLSSMLKNRANTIQHNLENAEMSKRKASELLTEQKYFQTDGMNETLPKRLQK